MATALLHQDRPADAAGLLIGGEAQRVADGNGTRSTGVGILYRPTNFPLKLIQVFRNSPAWQAGLRVGDSLTSFDGTELTPQTYPQLVAKFKSGATVTLIVRSVDEGAQPRTIELAGASHIQDDLTAELIENLLATVNGKLNESANDPGLLELRAEIAGQSSDYEQQATDYSAAIAALSEQPAEEVNDDLTRLYLRRGMAHAGLTKWQQALDDYDRGITKETSDEKILTSQAQAQAKVALAKRKHWTVLEPLTVESAGGAKLTVQDDKSVLASGKNPDRDVYTFIARPELKRITGILLEALPDPSLPRNGPGRRAVNGVGNFHLNEISVFSAGTPITLTDAVATFQERNPEGDEPGHAIDGKIDDRRGWSVNPAVGQAHSLTASLELERTVDDDLKFEFHFSTAKWKEHNLGKFRLSVTDVPEPKLLSEELLAADKLTNPWQQMAAVHRVEGDQQAIDQLVANHPASAGIVGDLFLRSSQEQDKDWARAIEVYSLGITPQAADTELLAKRAAAYEQLQNWEAAATDWARAASEDSAGAQLVADFANRLTEVKQYDLAQAQRERARKLLEDILQADPGDAAAVDSLSSLLVDISRPLQQWNVLKPAELKTSGGAVLSLLENDAVRYAQNRHLLTFRQNEAMQAVRVQTSAKSGTADGDAVPYEEYQIHSTSLPASGFRGRYLRIDLPGDNAKFPRRPADNANKVLTLAEVKVFQTRQNIATSGEARQSSTGFGGMARRAIDGNTHGIYTRGTSSHTAEGTDLSPWWELDLKSDQSFDRIVVWNRTDGNFGDRMKHFRIRVLDADRRVLFEQLVAEAPGPSVEIIRHARLEMVDATADVDALWRLDFDGHQLPQWGQRLRISVAEDVPTVTGDASESPEVMWTVPEPAIMNSAVGMILTAQADGSFLVEDSTADTLALPELPAEAKAIRLETASLSGSTEKEKLAFSEYRIQTVAAATAKSDTVQGRYVRLDLPGDGEEFDRGEGTGKDMINLAELQIFRGDQNIALQKKARQSTTFMSESEYGARYAVDGDTLAHEGSHRFAHTKPEENPWWEVDLGGEQAIDRLVVWNRAGQERRMNHFRVRILDQYRTVIFEQVIDDAPRLSRDILCKSLLLADTDKSRWSLRLGSETGLAPGAPFRISSAQQLTSLTEGDLDSADYLSLPFTRLAGAYDLNRETSTAAEWFGRALDDATN